jgi:hypothetical protein
VPISYLIVIISRHPELLANEVREVVRNFRDGIVIPHAPVKGDGKSYLQASDWFMKAILHITLDYRLCVRAREMGPVRIS